MTVIEFFDTNAVENIVSMLTYAPERIIFISFNNEVKKAIEGFKKIAAARNIDVEFSVKKIGRNDLDSIVCALSEITKAQDCVIDLTGGDELYLVAAGIVHSNSKGKVRLIKFNIPGGKIAVCSDECDMPRTDKLSLSVAENILAYGGRVIFEDERAGGCRLWSFDGELKADILALWSICRKNTNLWNKLVSSLSALYAAGGRTGNTGFDASSELFERADSKRMSGFLKELADRKLITGLSLKNGVSFKFKNNDIKQIVTRAGLLLELYVALLAKNSTDKKGEPVYNDVLTGVTIDWDGKLMGGFYDIGNEVDVVLMKGLVPVFISCKNGNVETSELYKLFAVAERFGGKYVKKVLVAPEVDPETSDGKYLSLRAESLGISLIHDIDKADEKKLLNVFSSLWMQ